MGRGKWPGCGLDTARIQLNLYMQYAQVFRLLDRGGVLTENDAGTGVKDDGEGRKCGN